LELRHIGNYLYDTPLYWTLIFSPLALFGIYFLVRRKHEQNLSDIAKMRNKKAAKISKKRLKAARKFIKENKEAQVYEELLRALWQYMADKLLIDQARLTRDTVLEMLNKYSVSQETVNKLIEVADMCEMAQYAPTATRIPIQEAYQQTSNLLVQLDRELK